MPDKENSSSMFEKVDNLRIEVKEHDELLDDHTMQLRVQAEQIKQLQDNGIRLENVVMSENRDTRLTITSTNAELHELIKGLMGFKSGQSQLSNTLAMAKLESMAKIVGILAGSGGILYYIFGK